ncbi:MAG: cyclopropane-fatty-acyl-phospholipid synthase [Chloroflexi bacterium]|nr:cyclopropane-fatty-acyl-phospholipid synthase [Chloroflexota bacterium]
MVPDGLLRLGVRMALRKRLRTLERGATRERMHRFQGGPVAVETEAANRQHYEVPTDFFRLILGPRLKYSSAFWPNGDTTLAQAEEAMLELTARRAQLADGQRVLDLGSGWGALSLWAAERFPTASFTALSNSRTQRHFMEARAAELGLSNLQVVAGNAAALELPGQFDRIVSIEILEHVRNPEPLLATLVNALAPSGRIFVHVFSHRRHAYTFEPEDGWMARWFFSGGTMPSLGLFDDCTPAVRTVDRQIVNGRHYARTLRCWLCNLDSHRQAVRALFERVYGDGAADLWIARWRLFFIACEELFAYRCGREWVVAHHLLEPAQRV